MYVIHILVYVSNEMCVMRCCASFTVCLPLSHTQALEAGKRASLQEPQRSFSLSPPPSEYSNCICREAFFWSSARAEDVGCRTPDINTLCAYPVACIRHLRGIE